MADFLPVRTKRLLGMDATSSPTILPEGIIQLIENMRPEREAFYTREGNLKYNSTVIPTGAGISGLGIYCHPVNGVRIVLTASGGSLFTGLAGVFVLRSADLSGALCKISQFNEKALILDSSYGLFIYNGVTLEAYFGGLPSPKTYTLIDSFELAADWTPVDCTVTNDRAHFIHGYQSVKITPDSGHTTFSINKVLSPAVTITTFPDGSAANEDDYISIYLIITGFRNITGLWLSLIQDGGTSWFGTDLTANPTWTSNTLDSVGLTIRVRRTAFTDNSGTPSWTDPIEEITLVGTCVTGTLPTINCDFLRSEKTGPIVHEHSKIISKIQNGETGITYTGTWTAAWSSTYTARDAGGVSAILKGTKTIILTFAAPLDLTTFDDGSAALDTDDIQIYLGKSTTLPATLVLAFTTSGGVLTSGTLNISAVKKLTPITFSKADFTGAGNWNSVSVLTITAGAYAGDIYVDEVSLIRHKGNIAVNLFESGETWVVGAHTTQTWETLEKYIRSDEGSVNSLKLSFQVVGAVRTDSAVRSALSLDLSAYSTLILRSDDDLLGLWVYLPYYKQLKSITLTLTDNGAKLATKTFLQEELPAFAESTGNLLAGSWFDLHIAITQWTVTSGFNWAHVDDLTVAWEVAADRASVIMYLDQWTIKREQALTGIYAYKVVFLNSSGDRSDGSLPSDFITLSGAEVYLTNIPISGSSTDYSPVVSREIYRIGGTSALWKLVATISDNSTTTLLDNAKDGSLGLSLTADITGDPYYASCMAVQDGIVVIGNLLTKDNIYYPCGILVSENGSCEVFNHLNFFEIEPNITSIKWLHSIFNFIFVGKEDSIWKFNPINLSEKPLKLTDQYGGVGLLSVVSGEDELFFLDSTGVISYNNSFFDRISDATPSHPSSVASYIEDIPSAYRDQCWMEYYQNTLFVGVVEAGGTYPTVILAWYPRKKLWYVIRSSNNGWNTSCAVSYKSALAGDILLLGHATAGFVYIGLEPSSNVDTSVADTTNEITSILHFPDRDFGEPESFKDYDTHFLFGRKLAAGTNVPITITPYVDSVAQTPLTEDFRGTTLSIDSLTGKKLEINFPQFGYLASYLGVKITAVGRWMFHSLTEMVRKI
jgi:hypothetical protein